MNLKKHRGRYTNAKIHLVRHVNVHESVGETHEGAFSPDETNEWSVAIGVYK